MRLRHMTHRPFLVLSRALALLCIMSQVPGNSFLMADEMVPDPLPGASSAPAAATDQPVASTSPSLTPQQIDSLVAPIALYPDELVSQLLVASTYPLEVVQAFQWMQQHPELKGKDLTTAAQQQNWDPSVQALVAFPDVMKRMNQDVTWTTNLGNAFLANQAGVMDEIQKMRSRAEASGKLQSTQQQTVTNTTDNGQPVVAIEPASPDVVYVPDYDPAWIWGPAPIYYPYPYWYYPPAPPLGLWCWWGGGIFVGAIFVGWHGWGGWGWHPGWYGHTIAMNHAFFIGNHFHDAYGGRVWAHDPAHRMGVAYPNRALAGHYSQSARPGFSHVTVGQAREQFNRSAARVQGDRIGSHQISARGYGQNRTAFGGVRAGSAARSYSNRGHSSLGHAHAGHGGGVSHGGGGGEGGHR